MKTLEDLKRDLGEELTDRLMEALPDEEYIIDWYYNKKLPALDNETPYNTSKKYGTKIIENLINEWDSGLAL